jgi:hypothetical protein
VKPRRTITSLAVLVVLAATLCVADAAQAGSLLSGYGGPGQGNQAILGSTLLGGPSGGGGGAAGGGEVGSPGSGSLSAAGPATSQGSGTAATGHSGAAHHGVKRSSAPATSQSPAPAPGARLAPSAASTREGSQPLGLSGDDLLYALLVLALLAATAALTLRLARPGPPLGSTKGMGRGTRVTE